MRDLFQRQPWCAPNRRPKSSPGHADGDEAEHPTVPKLFRKKPIIRL